MLYGMDAEKGCQLGGRTYLLPKNHNLGYLVDHYTISRKCKSIFIIALHLAKKSPIVLPTLYLSFFFPQ